MKVSIAVKVNLDVAKTILALIELALVIAFIIHST